METNVLSANNWPEFTPKATISAGVYVVTQDHAVTTNMTMQEGVTLIFDGGKRVMLRLRVITRKSLHPKHKSLIHR